jgi:lipopolysaccharide/colanic/teichoic acid biosynthesis glycosyltransferase
MYNSVRNQVFSKVKPATKRLMDLVIGLPCLLFFTPVIVIIALLVRIGSPGNPFFVQTRIGRNARPFPIFKIRTLYIEHFGIVPGEEEPQDYRITKIGKFLRRSKLDELPQLVNVVFGHMSLVGPRPDIPSQVAMYTKEQEERLLLKPGLTGITQISGNTALSWTDRIELDIFYIKNWSLLLDLKILGLTAASIIKGETIDEDPFRLRVDRG